MIVKSNPNAVINTRLEDDQNDWRDCYPVVRGGIIVGVIAQPIGSQPPEVLAGVASGARYDEAMDAYTWSVYDGAVILSGEGTRGTYRRHAGAPTLAALNAARRREEAHGDRWCRIYVPAGLQYADNTYVEIDADGNYLDLRTIDPEEINETTGAAARSLGSIRTERKAAAARENGKRGGRPTGKGDA